jgi:hypothetical protein
VFSCRWNDVSIFLPPPSPPHSSCCLDRWTGHWRNFLAPAPGNPLHVEGRCANISADGLLCVNIESVKFCSPTWNQTAPFDTCGSHRCCTTCAHQTAKIWRILPASDQPCSRSQLLWSGGRDWRKCHRPVVSPLFFYCLRPPTDPSHRSQPASGSMALAALAILDENGPDSVQSVQSVHGASPASSVTLPDPNQAIVVAATPSTHSKGKHKADA